MNIHEIRGVMVHDWPGSSLWPPPGTAAAQTV
jgi:hypothetical protein